LGINADARTRALKIGFLGLSGHKVETIEMIRSARKWDCLEREGKDART
jgi:hypothetical protein